MGGGGIMVWIRDVEGYVVIVEFVGFQTMGRSGYFNSPSMDLNLVHNEDNVE